MKPTKLLRQTLLIHVNVRIPNPEPGTGQVFQLNSNLHGRALALLRDEGLLAWLPGAVVVRSAIDIRDRAGGHLEFIANNRVLGMQDQEDR